MFLILIGCHYQYFKCFWRIFSFAIFNLEKAGLSKWNLLKALSEWRFLLYFIRNMCHLKHLTYNSIPVIYCGKSWPPKFDVLYRIKEWLITHSSMVRQSRQFASMTGGALRWPHSSDYRSWMVQNSLSPTSDMRSWWMAGWLVSPACACSSFRLESQRGGPRV